MARLKRKPSPIGPHTDTTWIYGPGQQIAAAVVLDGSPRDKWRLVQAGLAKHVYGKGATMARRTAARTARG